MDSLARSDSAISHVTAMQYVSEVLSIEQHCILPAEGHQHQLGDCPPISSSLCENKAIPNLMPICGAEFRNLLRWG